MKTLEIVASCLIQGKVLVHKLNANLLLSLCYGSRVKAQILEHLDFRMRVFTSMFCALLTLKP